MTMVFQIEDKALFNGLSEGDMVQFKAEKKGTALVVTSLEKMQHKGH
jgi:Cu(I)/Ag(I) efflux system periplasmic protein CusF